MIHYDYCSSREEWLEKRKNGIGGSAAGTILGVNPYETPWQYWARYQGLLPQKEETVATRMGHVLEPAVVQLFSEETGFAENEATRGDFLVTSDDWPHLIGSPDRIGTLDGEPFVLECKTTAKDIAVGDLPKSWYCQVQLYMMLTEIDKGAVAWLSRGKDFSYEFIERDDPFCAYLASRLESWWQTHIIGGVPPEIGAEDVDKAYIESVDRQQELTAEGYSAVMRIKELRQEATALTEEADRLVSFLKLTLKDSDCATFKGEKVATWRTSKSRKVFDVAAFRAEQPQLYEEYLRNRPGIRPFRIL